MIGFDRANRTKTQISYGKVPNF